MRCAMVVRVTADSQEQAEAMVATALEQYADRKRVLLQGSLTDVVVEGHQPKTVATDGEAEGLSDMPEAL